MTKKRSNMNENVFKLCNIIKINSTHYIKDVRLTLDKERQYLLTKDMQNAKRFSNQSDDYINKILNETGSKCITLSVNERE